MTKAWEEVVWDNGSGDDEWVVEYHAKCNGVTSKHLSILIAETKDEVQESLLEELKLLYPGTSPVEVTILSIKKAKDAGGDFGTHSLFTE